MHRCDKEQPDLPRVKEIDFEVCNSTTSAIRGRLPGESSCGPAGSVHRLGNVLSVDISIEVTLREGSRHGTTKIKLEQVPQFLINAFDYINCHGMDQEGLFRREGNASRLNQNNWAVYLGSAPIPPNFSVHDVCSMVKRFFRDLKEPLLSGSGLRARLFAMVTKNQISPVSRQEFAAVFEPKVDTSKKNVTFYLSRAHLGTLGYLMRQLYRISHNSAKHQMTSHNLATVFAPTLFRDEIQKDKMKRKERRGSQDDILISAREDTQLRIGVVQLLIEHANWIGTHPNCYLTSGHPRSSSAAPSPRQPPFLNVANLKEPPFAERKYSMKERTREGFKVSGERRTSSTFRFIADRLRPRRSPSKDRDKVTAAIYRQSTNRRASSPAIVVPNELCADNRIGGGRKTSTRYVLEFADSSPNPTQTKESHISRSRDALRASGTRTTRTRHHQSECKPSTQQRLPVQSTAQKGSKATSSHSAGRVSRHTTEPTLASSIVRRDSGKKRRESPSARASKVLKDTPVSLVSHEHFLSSYGEGHERSRRRHTTPVKTCTALRRNQPNTLHSGLHQPKRRATVVNANEQEKENRVTQAEASGSASSSCEELVEDNSTLLTNSSADLLAQRGQESRLRRVKRQQRRELSSILQKSLLDSSQTPDSSILEKDQKRECRVMVSTGCSPIVFPSAGEIKKQQQLHGSAVVGETIVVSTAPMLSPSADEPSLLNLPTDLNTTPPEPTSMVSPLNDYYHSVVQSPSRTVTVVSGQIAPTSFSAKQLGDCADPSGPCEEQSNVVFRIPSQPPHRDETISRSRMGKPDNVEVEKPQFLSSICSSKTLFPVQPRSIFKTSALDGSNIYNNSFTRQCQISSSGCHNSSDGLSSDDMFAASNEMKAAILNATSDLDISVHMDRQLRCRPSVALIEKQGIVRERVNQFRRLGNLLSAPLEPISGRSSGLSSRSSLGTGSAAGDDDFVKPSAPPVTHSLNMNAPRRNSATPITTSVSLLNSSHSPSK
ncbi:hypothetical protein RB195_014935 [Necator americanus]|uniref:Rho-GAP domain-containing protein n=1 Tax=Necator americanus TaxID=51031 RepID=A0ABR1E291_NECAM